MLVSDLIDRVFSEWLEPAGVNRPTFDVLSVIQLVGDRQFTVEGLVNNLPGKALFEIDDEVQQGRSVAGGVVQVAQRGYLETDPAEHAAGSIVRVNPEFFRVTVFNALKTVIGLLYGWGIYNRQIDTAQVLTTTAPVSIAGAKRVISIRRRRRGSTLHGPFLRPGMDYEVLHDVVPPEIQFFRGSGGSPLRIVYARDFTKPVNMGANLNASGLSDEIQEALPMAVAAQLLQGREVPRLNVEEIKKLLAQMGAQVPVGATFNVAQALMKTFRDTYVDAERERLIEQDPVQFEYVGH